MICLRLMKTTIDTRFFRAGVGTVIYNQKGEIALFERSQHPVGVWQFQQGGIDLGEDTETTLWRELREEIGLTKNDFDYVVEYENWTIHSTPSATEDSDKSRIGQAHKWYFLELKSDVKIDLTKATEDEASNFRWVTFTEAIGETEEFKKHVYKELEEFFKSKIQLN
jgi:putative (di)nucleoside polyphosphate hydrolase